MPQTRPASTADQPDTSAATRVGEDFAGAEFLAGRELGTEAGLAIDLAGRLAELQQRQVKQWLEDWQQTAAALSQQDPATACISHMARRFTHLNEGAAEAASLIAATMNRFWAQDRQLWSPFEKLLERDATRR